MIKYPIVFHTDLGEPYDDKELEFLRLELENHLNDHIKHRSPWMAAIRAIEKKRNPAPLLALLNIPPDIAPYVKDLFDRKMGPRDRRRSKVPLWRPGGTIALAASLVQMAQKYSKNSNLSVAKAVDQVFKDNRWIAEEITTDHLIDYVSGKSQQGRRAKKKRQSK